MQTTVTATTATTRRQSREGQRNTKVELAYRSLRYLGGGKVAAAPQYAALNDHTESWLCASQTQRVHPCDYLVTHDMVTGNTHCSCTAGVYGRDCVHQAAVRRKLADRRAEMAGYDMLYGEYTSW